MGTLLTEADLLICLLHRQYLICVSFLLLNFMMMLVMVQKPANTFELFTLKELMALHQQNPFQHSEENH
jgi:hypothetical protein